MTAFNNYKSVTLQSLVDDPDCSEEDVAQWVQDNDEKFEDDSHPGEFSHSKVNKLFGDLIQNNAFGSLGNLGIDCSSSVDWFNIVGGQNKEEKPEQGGAITGSLLSWGKQLLGLPGSEDEKKPTGGFGLGKIDIGSLIKQSKNPKLKKVLWVLDTVFKEIKKRWSSMRKTTSRRTTTRKTTSRSRTTTAKKTVAKKTPARTTAAKKTTSRSTTAKKTVAKKTPTRTTAAKKTTASRSTTAKKTR